MAEKKQIIFTSFVRRGKSNKKKKKEAEIEESGIWILFGKFLDFQKNEERIKFLWINFSCE